MNNTTPSRKATVSREDVAFPVVPRRDRIHVLREFMLETFEFLKCGCKNNNNNNSKDSVVVLDVAGGRGDLSFVLVNADNHFVNAVIVDPRLPEHDKIATTCTWYAQHPVQAAEQAAAGQALPRLNLQPPFKAPRHLRLFFEEALLQVWLQQQEQDRAFEAFEAYWNDTRRRIQKLETKFPSHWQTITKAKTTLALPPNTVNDSKEAWNLLNNASLVVGFHSDQATDACIDFALQRHLPFCVVPCCVFTATFPHRKTIHGRPVSTYQDYVQYLRNKHARMRMTTLPFASTASGHGAGLARNTVLYMLPQDYL